MVKKVGVRVTGSYSWLDWADCMDRRMLMEESYRFLSDWWIDRCSMFDIYWNNPYYWTFSENIYMQIQSSTKWVIATLYFNAIRWLNIYIIIVAYSKLGHQVKKLSHKSVNQKKKKSHSRITGAKQNKGPNMWKWIVWILYYVSFSLLLSQGSVTSMCPHPGLDGYSGKLMTCWGVWSFLRRCLFLLHTR